MPMPVVARNMSTGPRQHVLGRRAQRVVVDLVGVQRQRRRPLDVGAAALEQADLLVDLPGGGDADRKPARGRVTRLSIGELS